MDDLHTIFRLDLLYLMSLKEEFNPQWKDLYRELAG
jgi:hypothetical protein